jgi:hypothetical protein
MDPMTVMGIGSAVAGGLQSIFGGKAQGAAIRQQNEQALRNWIQANSQKTLNNAREQFQAAYQATQQLKRNSAIMKAAWENEWEAKQSLNYQSGFQQSELSKQIMQQKAALGNAMISKGISANSGMYASLAVAQSIDALRNASILKRNVELERRNIEKQTKNMLSQMTENIYMPNIQLYDEAPIFGDPSGAERGGLISGLVQIGGALGGAAIGMSRGSGTDSGFNPSNNAYTNRTSGGSVGGR